MSGSTERERQPTDDAEFAREVDRRLDEQEQPESTRCGEWTISTDDAGNLRACHSDGGCVTLAEKPPAGTDPDGEYIPPPVVIDEHKTPRIKVKGGIQNIPNNSPQFYNQLNTTVDFEEPAGTWTHDASSITIPVDGDYLVILYMPWASNAGGTDRSTNLIKNGTIVDLDTQNPPAGYAYDRVVNAFRCATGDVFTIQVYQNSGAALNCGGANFGDAWCQFTIIRLADSDIPEHEVGSL